MSNYLFISEAAKEIKVESHVLRYWEEELHLPIKRNELGHRYYTEEDVERFKQIKGMKERGLQLKAIKMILKDGKLDVLAPESKERGGKKPDKSQEAENMEKIMEKGVEKNLERGEERSEERSEEKVDAPQKSGIAIDVVASGQAQVVQENREEKARRLQWLLQQLIRETLQENNGELCKEIRESVVKELDYQFRMQEEREEARDKSQAERDEVYYKKMDELLRKKTKGGFHFGRKKKGTSQ